MTGTEMEGLTWCSSIDRDCNVSLWLTPPLMEWYVRTLPWGQPPAEEPHQSRYQALPCRASSPDSSIWQLNDPPASAGPRTCSFSPHSVKGNAKLFG
jgi:hypothetical protein